MKTVVLYKGIYILAGLKCGTRTLRTYLGMATDKNLIEESKQNQIIGHKKAQELSQQYTIGLKLVSEYDKDGVDNYNKIYNENLYYRDFLKFLDNTDKIKTKILIIRDPVARFASAFSMIKTNILNKECSLQTFIDNFDFFMWKYPYHYDHFRPITYVYGLNPSWYDQIYDIKQINEVKKYIEKECGYELPDVQANRGRDTSSILNNLTEAQIDWIKQRYIIDYRVYGKYFS